jgi:hypothetical protein
VFFTSSATSGHLKALVEAIPSRDTFIVIDGYHGFMACPTDLSEIAGRAFYLSGGSLPKFTCTAITAATALASGSGFARMRRTSIRHWRESGA